MHVYGIARLQIADAKGTAIKEARTCGFIGRTWCSCATADGEPATVPSSHLGPQASPWAFHSTRCRPTWQTRRRDRRNTAKGDWRRCIYSVMLWLLLGWSECPAWHRQWLPRDVHRMQRYRLHGRTDKCAVDIDHPQSRAMTTDRRDLSPRRRIATSSDDLEFLPRDAVLAWYVLWPCARQSFRPSVASRSSIKRIIMRTTPYDSPSILVFLFQRSCWNANQLSQLGLQMHACVGNFFSNFDK